MSRTIEQKRAAFALKRVQGFRGGNGGNDKMSTHINKTPIRILSNGLGQSLAFLQADNDGKHGGERKESGRLFDLMQEWLCGVQDEDHPCRVYADNANVMAQLMAGSRNDYMRAQEEALSLYVWLKKFTDAGMLGTGATSDMSPEVPTAGVAQQGDQHGNRGREQHRNQDNHRHDHHGRNGRDHGRNR